MQETFFTLWQCYFLQNLNQNPRTLLPKFFGLYCYRCNSKNVRLVAMNNLLPSSVKLHQKYDLKGSTYKRKVCNITEFVILHENFRVIRLIYNIHNFTIVSH